jgi:hypothetical protein
MDLAVEVHLTNGQKFQHVQSFPDNSDQFGSEYPQFLDYLKAVLGRIVPGTKAARSVPPLVLLNPTAFYNVDHVVRVGWSEAVAEEIQAEIEHRELGFLATLRRNI